MGDHTHNHTHIHRGSSLRGARYTHLHSPLAVRGLKLASVLRLVCCSHHRSQLKPSLSETRRRLRLIHKGELQSLWNTFLASLPRSPPRTANAHRPSPRSALLRAFHLLRNGSLARAWDACTDTQSSLLNPSDPAVAAKLAALHPQSPLPPPRCIPDDVTPFDTPVCGGAPPRSGVVERKHTRIHYWYSAWVV